MAECPRISLSIKIDYWVNKATTLKLSYVDARKTKRKSAKPFLLFENRLISPHIRSISLQQFEEGGKN